VTEPIGPDPIADWAAQHAEHHRSHGDPPDATSCALEPGRPDDPEEIRARAGAVPVGTEPLPASHAAHECMYSRVYFQAAEALDEILGTEEEDGAGEGLVADIWLVAEQRDEALRAILAKSDAHVPYCDEPRWEDCAVCRVRVDALRRHLAALLDADAGAARAGTDAERYAATISGDRVGCDCVRCHSLRMGFRAGHAFRSIDYDLAYQDGYADAGAVPATTEPPAVTPVAASGADNDPQRAALRERIARAIADECRGNGGWPEGGGVYDRAERDHWHACADRVFEVLEAGDG
jgi:hypothetical protein